MLITRSDIIDYCLTFAHAYEDYPFDDVNWTVMRRRDTRRGFAWIFERDGQIWVNVKSDPDDALAFRWVMVNMAISFIVLLAVNMLERKERRKGR